MSETAKERAERLDGEVCRFHGQSYGDGSPMDATDCVQCVADEIRAAEDAAREEELDFVESKLQLHLHDGSIRWHGVHNVAIKQALGVVARRRKALRALAGEEGEG